MTTSLDRDVTVVQGLEEFEKTADELRLIKAVLQGLIDVREGRTVSLIEARQILGVH